MTENGINWWRSPPESPDLNPSENLWHEMKYFCVQMRPRNKADLEASIIAFWSTVTPAKCCKYIDHLKKVMPVVVEKQGDVSGY